MKTYNKYSSSLLIVLLASLMSFSSSSSAALQAQTLFTEHLPNLGQRSNGGRTAYQNILALGREAVPLATEALVTIQTQEQTIADTAGQRTPPSITPIEIQQLEASGAQQTQLIRLMGLSGTDLDSLNAIIQTGRLADPRAEIHQLIFMALSNHELRQQAGSYAVEVLNSSTANNRMKRLALELLANLGKSQYSSQAQSFLQDSQALELRAVAAYIAAEINATALLPDIKALASSSPHSQWNVYTAYALAILTSTSDFQGSVNTSSLSTADYASAQRVNQLWQGSADKDVLLKTMLSSNAYPPEQRFAVKYLLEKKGRSEWEQYGLIPSQSQREAVDQKISDGDLNEPREIHFLSGTKLDLIRSLGYRAAGSAESINFTKAP